MAADFIEHRLLRDWPSDSAALVDAVAALQAKGATRLRARFGDRHLVVEGWRDRPTGRTGGAPKPRAREEALMPLGERPIRVEPAGSGSGDDWFWRI